jgi:hypothetical protein
MKESLFPKASVVDGEAGGVVDLVLLSHFLATFWVELACFRLRRVADAERSLPSYFPRGNAIFCDQMQPNKTSRHQNYGSEGLKFESSRARFFRAISLVADPSMPEKLFAWQVKGPPAT